MSKAKITITVDEELLTRVDRLLAEMPHLNRSRYICEAIQEKLERTAPYSAEMDELEPDQDRPKKEVGTLPEEWSDL